jgi:NitT/TauT family transport system substrate-binding protein
VRNVRSAAVAVLLALTCLSAGAAETLVKVGTCSRTIGPGNAPLAIAQKMGWYARDGFKVEIVPIGGSSDCVKFVATKDVAYSIASVEPLMVLRAQGVKVKTFYTAYQGNIYGIAVPASSPVQRFADLKGKSIGVISMGSAGVIIARALASIAGLDPDHDVRIVVAGEGAQTAALLRTGQIDALSQFDTQYAMVENAGVKLRRLDAKSIERFPSNGFVALEETLAKERRQSVAVARGYAMGTVFALANPEAAVRILWEMYPQTRSTGKDEATALKDDVKVLLARAESWKLERSGVKRWGENVEKDYGAYAEFLHKWGVVQETPKASDLVTNDLIAEINDFDAAKVIAEAKRYPPR